MLPIFLSTIFFPVVILQGITTHTPKKQVLSSHEMSLEKRYANSFVNGVFKDNILLDMAYMAGKVKDAKDVNWSEIEKPFHYEMVLQPSEVFAFHDAVLPQYQNKDVLASPAHFNYDEGFKSDGYLTGDGVCHLASLIDWATKDAGLLVEAPTNHDFANIPEIPKQYGVAIYSQKNEVSTSAAQNLYVTNNKNKPVTLAFDYKDSMLSVTVEETK